MIGQQGYNRVRIAEANLDVTAIAVHNLMHYSHWETVHVTNHIYTRITRNLRGCPSAGYSLDVKWDTSFAIRRKLLEIRPRIDSEKRRPPSYVTFVIVLCNDNNSNNGGNNNNKPLWHTTGSWLCLLCFGRPTLRGGGRKAKRTFFIAAFHEKGNCTKKKCSLFSLR